MTDMQKEQINEMRKYGCTYRHIATTLSLKEGTVKSYCLRAIKKGLLVLPKETDKTKCKNCGAPITHTPKRKKRIFCSAACRQKWWNSHLYMGNKSSDLVQHFTCKHCTKQFTAYANPNRKYCSHECYINDRFYQEDSNEQ